MRTPRRQIAIELCSGVGGMSLGFEQAGFEVVAAFDLEERHVETYRKNFPQTRATVLDLAKATGADIRRLARIGNRSIDVLFGGPPCQGFSPGGRRSVDDPRNALILHFARLVRELNPKYFLVENVYGVLGHLGEATVASFRRRVRRAGFDVVEPIQVLNAADYGVPQRRKRAFILGHRKSLPPPAYPERCPLILPNGTEHFPTVRDAIADLPDVDAFEHLFETDVLSVRLGKPSYYAQLMRCEVADPDDRSSRREGPRTTLTGCLRTKHAKAVVKRFRRTKPGSAEPVSRYFRLEYDSVAPTIRAGTDIDHGRHTAPRPIHPEKPRCITVREAARLHSFPDWFQFHSTRWHAFRQIGNSVPPRLARCVAEKVFRVLAAKRGAASRERRNGSHAN